MGQNVPNRVKLSAIYVVKCKWGLKLLYFPKNKTTIFENAFPELRSFIGKFTLNTDERLNRNVTPLGALD